MNIIAVDDEELALSALRDAISEAVLKDKPVCFIDTREALDYAKETAVDVAFLDVKMDGMDGLSLARNLTAIRPRTNIIFVTGYSEYLEKAFEQYASGYVKKPVQVRRILREIENLRYPISEDTESKKVRVFGSYMFDHVTQRVYYNGQDTMLKTKEFHLFHLFAANPDKTFTAEELFEKIWGEEPKGSLHTVTVHISGLRKKLYMDEEDNPIIRKRRGGGYYLEQFLGMR